MLPHPARIATFGWSSTSVLAHHACIFVLKNVAMIHKWVLARGRLRELEQQLGLALHEGDVLPAYEMIRRWVVTQGENSEQRAVHMEGMRQSGRGLARRFRWKFVFPVVSLFRLRVSQHVGIEIERAPL